MAMTVKAGEAVLALVQRLTEATDYETDPDDPAKTRRTDRRSLDADGRPFSRASAFVASEMLLSSEATIVAPDGVWAAAGVTRETAQAGLAISVTPSGPATIRPSRDGYAVQATIPAGQVQVIGPTQEVLIGLLRASRPAKREAV